MLTAHRAAGTWSRAVDVWIALTEFARSKFVAGGLPPDRVVVKPNFVSPDPGYSRDRDTFALFVGRLSQEKGIHVLLSAWRALAEPMRLKIAGDGPLQGLVQEAAAVDPRIEYLGMLPGDAIRHQMNRARILVFPSIWYEGLPLTVLEAYATGLPVIAGRIGAMINLVEPGVTGLHFEPGDAADLAAKLAFTCQNPQPVAAMGRRARDRYLADYTAESNYRKLMQVYEMALRGSYGNPLRHECEGTEKHTVIDHIPVAYGPTRCGAT